MDHVFIERQNKNGCYVRREKEVKENNESERAAKNSWSKLVVTERKRQRGFAT